MLEQEVKIELLHRADLERFAAALADESSLPPRSVRQTNHYFDAPDLCLARALTMLRLREADGRVVLAYKAGTQVEAGSFSSLEIESELPLESLGGLLARPGGLLDIDVPPTRALLERHGRIALERIASLENRRRIFKIESFTIELDAMRFAGGGEEFEIEVESETPEAARRFCLERLAALGIESRPGTETKFQRVLRRMGRR
jgi:adenylate cyclase class IV